MFVFLDYLRLNCGGLAGAVVNGDECSGRQAFAGAEHRPPRAFAGGLGEEYFYGGLADFFLSAQAGWDAAGIVQNQNGPGAKELGQIGKMMMRTLARGAIGNQKPRAIAGRGGVLGN